MGTKHPNFRLVKSLLTYTIDQAADCLGVHKNTIRQWLKEGLSPIDRRRPTLIHGEELIRFLKDRRLKNRHPCGTGQIYCIRCRVPKNPAENMADYIPLTANLGHLRGICPTCSCIIQRSVGAANLDRVIGSLDVRIQEAEPRIRERSNPPVNCDLEGDARDGNAQRR